MKILQIWYNLTKKFVLSNNCTKKMRSARANPPHRLATHNRDSRTEQLHWATPVPGHTYWWRRISFPPRPWKVERLPAKIIDRGTNPRAEYWGWCNTPHRPSFPNHINEGRAAPCRKHTCLLREYQRPQANIWVLGKLLAHTLPI